MAAVTTGLREGPAASGFISRAPAAPVGGRLAPLDGLRGVAVLAVLLFHAGYFLVPSVDANLLPGGFLGVDLFFVLSGFLMTDILVRQRRSFGRFYLRRAARIFPALYLFLAVSAIYFGFVGTAVSGYAGAYAMIVFGSANWGTALGVTLPFGLGQTWSLGVEEQLYLIWPLVVVLTGRDPRRVGRLCLAGAAISMVAKLALFKSGVGTPDIYSQTECRLDDFLAGAFVATVWSRKGGSFVGRGALTGASATFLGVCALVAHPFTQPWLYEGGYTAVAVACGVVLYAALGQQPGTGFLACRPLRSAGRYSYSLYLWHPLVFLAASRSIPHDTALRVVVAMTLLAGVSVASTRWVEEPLRRRAARIP